MREILFRAKCAEAVYNGEWYYGHYVHQYGADMIYLPDGADGECGFDYYHIDTETLGQYTGLTDKNGKKIFEGDIIDCWSEGVNAQGTVQQRRDGLWIIYPAWQKHIMWGLCPDEYSHTTVEVIGNVYDNPELIKT